MRNVLLILGILGIGFYPLSAQVVEAEGSIKIGNSGNDHPAPGTIRYLNGLFEGWNGLRWVAIGDDGLAIADVDGNRYSLVTIGSQIWMGENLKTTTLSDMAPIPLLADSADWVDASGPGYCWINNDMEANIFPYGALYNWYAVGTGKLCPTGWRVPSASDWSNLKTFLGSDSGLKLKSIGGTFWDLNNLGTNESGFSAVAGGYRSSNNPFNGKGLLGEWHHSDDAGAGTPGAAWLLSGGNDLLTIGLNGKSEGVSVRCLKDNL